MSVNVGVVRNDEGEFLEGVSIFIGVEGKILLVSMRCVVGDIPSSRCSCCCGGGGNGSLRSDTLRPTELAVVNAGIESCGNVSDGGESAMVTMMEL